MKSKAVYICQECGYQTAKWLGKCPGCNQWNTLLETIVKEEKKTTQKAKGKKNKKYFDEIVT